MQGLMGPKVDEGNHFHLFCATRCRQEIKLFQTRLSTVLEKLAEKSISWR